MSKNQVPVGHIHTHSPQLPWINKKTKTWWIGNHDTKQPYRGVKGDSVKGDTGDRGNGWFLLSSSTDVSPEGAITDDLIMNSGTGDIMVAGVIVEPGEYVQVLSVNPFQVTDVLGSLKGPKGTEGDAIVGPPGNSLEIRYAKNKDPENAPTLNRSDRSPSGWSVSTINPESDEFVWETRGYVDWENDLVGMWSNPFRNTGMPGDGGSTGGGAFKSMAFTVSPTQPATPTGGTWLSPVPTTPGWHDGIPDEDGPRWMSTRIFTLSGTAPQEPNWSEPVLLADSADIDFEFSSVETSPGNPTDNPTNWSNDSSPSTIWMAVRKYSNGSWSNWEVSRIKGEDGTDGQDGQNGTGYEFQYSVTNIGDGPPSISNDSLWSTTFPGSIDSSQTLWYRQRTVVGTTHGSWVGPIRMSGQDGESIEGPSMAYRGDWSAIKEYSGNPLVVDVVKYAELGYIARTDAGDIPVGTLPTDTDYWNEFTENIDSLFTDFLFAYSGYIQNLTVGVVSTGVEPETVPDPTLSGERYTVGFQPSESHDPTTGLSRHGQRMYFPSGRIMMYQGWVNSFPVGDEDLIENKGAVIWFKDEENSPIDYYIDGGVIIIPTPTEIERWYPVSKYRRLGGNTSEITSLLFGPGTEGSSYSVKSGVSCWSWQGETWENYGTYGIKVLGGPSGSMYKKVITDGSTETVDYVIGLNSYTPVPDGWYALPESVMYTSFLEGNDEWAKFDMEINLFQIVGGEIVDTMDYGINNIITLPSPEACGTNSIWGGFFGNEN